MNNLLKRNITSLSTPIGSIHIYSEGDFIKQIFLPGCRPIVPPDTEIITDIPPGHPLIEAIELIKKWFEGYDIKITENFKITGTIFQIKVWEALKKIPRGEVLSYGQLAALIGKPRAARAVGQAVGKNPLPIIIPCHRVIAADGSIGGFGGGEDLKRKMLEIEGAIIK